MGDEQPAGETETTHVRKSTKAIPPEDPVVVVNLHLVGMSPAQRGAVSQLIVRIRKLERELVVARLESDPDTTNDDPEKHDPHGLGEGWSRPIRSGGDRWAHITGAMIWHSSSEGWSWRTAVNQKKQRMVGFADDPKEAALLALGVETIAWCWTDIRSIAGSQLQGDVFNGKQHIQICHAIVEALKAYDESKGVDRD